jgi:hypothetical protein
MRRLIVWNMMTPFDGYFERPKPWEIEELKRFSLDQAREAGVLLFGRNAWPATGRPRSARSRSS